MNILDIEKSINNWFDLQYSNTISWGAGLYIDPTATDLNEWVEFCVTVYNPHPTRKPSLRQGRLSIQVNCWARDEDSYIRAKSVASEVLSLLIHKEIDIQDFSASGEPRVGHARLDEPMLKEETLGIDKWQLCILTVDGRYQEV